MKEEINCKKLYEEYIKAKHKITDQVLNQKSPGNYNLIDNKDVTKRYELAKELIKYCEPFLKDKPGKFLIVQRDANV